MKKPKVKLVCRGCRTYTGKQSDKCYKCAIPGKCPGLAKAGPSVHNQMRKATEAYADRARTATERAQRAFMTNCKICFWRTVDGYANGMASCGNKAHGGTDLKYCVYHFCPYTRTD